MTDYGTQRIRREQFKMSVTAAIRAHNNHEQDIAARHYEAAAVTAAEGYAPFQSTLAFLSTQADSSGRYTLGQSINHAIKCGYARPLKDLLPLIEDPEVRGTLEECIVAAGEGRKASTRTYKRQLVDTPSGGHPLP